MDEDVNQRFVIENGKMIKVDETEKANMGESSTMADFLKWGVQNFAADKMGVVLWDHGGGSITGVCYDENEDSDYEYEEDDSDGHWSYVDEGEAAGESPYITFYEEPEVDEDGVYYFVLDEQGNKNAADVIAYVYTLSADGDEYIEFGETHDLVADWDEGYFADAFDGNWLSLPDGQNLATYIVDVTKDYIIYSSPILLNDEETNLRIRSHSMWMEREK